MLVLTRTVGDSIIIEYKKKLEDDNKIKGEKLWIQTEKLRYLWEFYF